MVVVTFFAFQDVLHLKNIDYIVIIQVEKDTSSGGKVCLNCFAKNGKQRIQCEIKFWIIAKKLN